MQKLLTVIITGFILYIIVQTRMEETKQNRKSQAPTAVSSTSNSLSPSPTPELEGNLVEKTLSSIVINILKTDEGRLFFENILQPVNKPLSGIEGFKVNNEQLIKTMLKITDFSDGIQDKSAGPASCGHVATIHYKILSMEGRIIDEEDRTFLLGSMPVIPGLDSVVAGMRVGQTRHAVLMPVYAYQRAKYRKTGIDLDSSYKVSVQLKAILPENFLQADEIKIFDDEIAYKIPLMCGDNVKFHARITKLSTGEVIYNSKNSKNGSHLQQTIGNINYPMIFSHALYGKIPVGTRTVITKGRAFKSLATSNSVIFPKEQLPPDEYFMLELSDIILEQN